MRRVALLFSLAVLGVIVGAMATGSRAGQPAASTPQLLRGLTASAPTFGTSADRTLRVRYELGAPADVRVEVLHAGRVVRRTTAGRRDAGVTYTLRLPAAGLPRGDYAFRLTATRGARRVTARVVSRRV